MVSLIMPARNVKMIWHVLIAKATILPSHECPRWKVEKQVQQVKVEKHLSFYKARKLVETSTSVAASKSYAAAVKVSTTNIATQTDLIEPNAEDKLKNSGLEKVKKKAVKSTSTINTGVFGFTKSHLNLTSITNFRKLKIEPLGEFPFLLMGISTRI